MKVFIDRQKVDRRARLSNIASSGGLILLLAGVVMPLFAPEGSSAAYVLMFVGMGAAMVGIYFANRWVRKPRPEDSLAGRLKSLDDRYHLYHYLNLPCDHLLLTPTGIVILEVFNLAGDFSYKQGRWREAMTVGRALRYIVEDRISDPLASAGQLKADLKEIIARELGPGPEVKIKPVFVFTHPAVRLEVQEAPVEICRIDKLRKQIMIEAPRLTAETYGKLSSFFERAALGGEKQ